MIGQCVLFSLMEAKAWRLINRLLTRLPHHHTCVEYAQPYSVLLSICLHHHRDLIMLIIKLEVCYVSSISLGECAHVTRVQEHCGHKLGSRSNHNTGEVQGCTISGIDLAEECTHEYVA